MNRVLRAGAILILVLIMSPIKADSLLLGEPSPAKRVPAEWEPQAAIWLQWPGRWEKAHETAFAQISMVIAEYETLHILHGSNEIRDDARLAISKLGGNPDHRNIVWHAIANDNAWMRDNGPVYVVDGGELRIQNWAFDAWGGSVRVSCQTIALYMGLPVSLSQTNVVSL